MNKPAVCTRTPSTRKMIPRNSSIQTYYTSEFTSILLKKVSIQLLKMSNLLLHITIVQLISLLNNYKQNCLSRHKCITSKVNIWLFKCQIFCLLKKMSFEIRHNFRDQWCNLLLYLSFSLTKRPWAYLSFSNSSSYLCFSLTKRPYEWLLFLHITAAGTSLFLHINSFNHISFIIIYT